MMIFRISTGRADSLEDVKRYASFLDASIFPELRTLSGQRGGYLLHRSADDGEQVVIITIWDSFDSIRAFAGDDLEAAVFEPEAQRLLPVRNPRVCNYEVVLQPDSEHP